MKRFVSILVAAALCTVGASAHASVTSRCKDIVVMLPADLPEAAQLPGQSMELHSFPMAPPISTLYIEQQQMQRILVLDVSNLPRVRSLASVRMDIPAPFDFARDLGSSAVLVCYRDSRGSAVMDFQKRKDPVITPASSLVA